MPSKDPFYFSLSEADPPVVCTACGHNMYCVDHPPPADAKYQLLVCKHCLETIERIVGAPESDDAEQGEAEARASHRNDNSKSAK